MSFNTQRMQAVSAAYRLVPPLVQNKDTEKPTALIASAVAQYFENILQAAEEGKPIVYHHFCLMPEIIYAFGLQPVNLEMMVAIPAFLIPGSDRELVDTAQERGVHMELCSANRASIGEMFLKTLPPPAMVLSQSQPCDSSRAAYQMIREITGAPQFILDSPYWDTEDVLEYYEQQLLDLIAFMEEHSHRKLDWDRLREVMDESNRMAEYWLELNELKKLVPCPSDSKTGPYAAIAGTCLAGHPLATRVLKGLRDDAKERAQLGKGVCSHERIRANWFYIHVIYDALWMNKLQEQYGAVSVMDMLSYYRVTPMNTSSPKRMLRSLAQRNLTAVPMGRQGRGGADIFLNDLMQTTKEWKADCVIFAGNAGCKWLKACIGMAREELKEKFGVPVLYFDIDIFDPRFRSAVEYRKEVEDFFSTMLPSKATA